MRIFYIAEITGKAGVWAVKKNITEIRHRYRPDFLIANADKATGAGGLGRQHAGYLRKMGIDCVTGGDCIFQKKDLVDHLAYLPFVLRPYNVPERSPGEGYRAFTTRSGETLIVVSLVGRVGYHRLLSDNPFVLMQVLLPKLKGKTPFIVVDFSATATAEKQTMAFMLAGKVSALIGSGTGAATADTRLMVSTSGGYDYLHSASAGECGRDQGGTMNSEAVLEAGTFQGGEAKSFTTAYITDAGRTGSFDSVGGYEPYSKIREYRTGLFEYPKESWQRVCLQGLDILLDKDGSAQSIEWVKLEVPADASPQV